MKKAAIFIILFIVLVALAGLFIKNKVNQMKQLPLMGRMITLDSITGARLKDAVEESKGIKINKSIQLTTSKGEKISIGDVIKEPPKLFFVFESDSCEECIDRELVMTKMLENNMKKNSIIYISSFNNFQKQKKVEKERDITIYNIGEKRFGLPVEKFGLPFIFVVDTNYTTQAISPSVGLALMLRLQYYNIILMQYSCLSKK